MHGDPGLARGAWGPSGRRVCAVGALALLGVVLLATLYPMGGEASSGFDWHLLSRAGDLADVLSNVLLFLPLAAALRCAGVGTWRTVAAGALLSAAIEFTQLRLVPGRDASFSDLFANTLGAAAGAALAAWAPVRIRSAARGVLAAAVSLAAVAAAGWLSRPSLPATRYYAQWTPNLGQYDRYRGAARSAEIGGVMLPQGRLDQGAAVRRLLLEGATLRVQAVAGPRPASVAPIFAIADGRQNEILMLGADGNDLVLHGRVRAEDLLLRPVERRWRGALAAVVPGDSLALTVRRATPGYCLGVNGRERCGIAPTAGDLWTFVQTLARRRPAVHRLLGLVTMVLLGFPAGFLTSRRRLGWVGPALLVGGAAVAPLLVGLAPTPILQLTALALGSVAGVLVP